MDVLARLDYEFLSKDKGAQSTYMHTHIDTRHVTTKLHTYNYEVYRDKHT